MKRLRFTDVHRKKEKEKGEKKKSIGREFTRQTRARNRRVRIEWLSTMDRSPSITLSLPLDAVETALRGGNGSGAHFQTDRPVIIEQTVGSWWVKLASRIERLTGGRRM